jgi:FkbM family methyltransferase
MKIFFDVGANNGSSSLHLLNDSNNDWIVYAFEPTPYLVDLLKKESNNNKNYNVIPMVVGNENKMIKFNIAGHHDWGCSSVLNFNNNLNETWNGREDFYFNNSVDVQMIKLKDFCLANDIKKIDYLHVDAQGFDYEVLDGLEEMIDIVEEGCVETAQNHLVKLYENQKYVLDDMLKFLIKHNFSITNIISNDRYHNELNVYFKKN